MTRLDRLAGPISRISLWVHVRSFIPVSEMRKGRRQVVVRLQRKKANMAKHKVITFAPVIALETLIAESLLSNGMLMMWKIQQAKQNNEELIQSKNSSRFYPGNRAEVFINFQPSYRNSGWKNGRDIGNRARKKFRGMARSRKPSSYHMKTM